jgi:hypothetical protein
MPDYAETLKHLSAQMVYPHEAAACAAGAEAIREVARLRDQLAAANACYAAAAKEAEAAHALVDALTECKDGCHL